MKLRYEEEEVGIPLLDVKQGQLFTVITGHNRSSDRVHIRHSDTSEWLSTVVAGHDAGNQYFWTKGSNRDPLLYGVRDHQASLHVRCQVFKGKLIAE